MKAKDVIVGRLHLLGFDQVMVTQALPHPGNKFMFSVRDNITGEVSEVWAKALGSVKSKQEQAMSAKDLNQPHRQAIEADQGPLREMQRQRALERGFAPHKRDWAVHPSSAFKCLVHTDVAHIEFGHQLELELAQHLETCKIKWALEPVQFELADGKGFRPDFYLPALDLYVELTQDDAEAKKRPKLKSMALLHERVRVIALDSPQVHDLLELDAQRLIQRLGEHLATERSRAEKHRLDQAQATSSAS